jgi:medium-chain acyl-[acyl-carrier-protein] hydrolase
VIRPDEKKFHMMNDEAFRREVIELGGTPPEFFNQPELMRLFLPLLKNDFRISETVARDQTPRPLDIDITVLLGKDDDLTAEQCNGWKMHTAGRCTVHYFPGAHFFLHNEVAGITRIINQTLLPDTVLLPSNQV